MEIRPHSRIQVTPQDLWSMQDRPRDTSKHRESVLNGTLILIEGIMNSSAIRSNTTRYGEIAYVLIGTWFMRGLKPYISLIR